ncbi:putative beta-glucosidase J [Grifola frondosa]|uniref:beta-glucosidase n=1 Tax=Grifola frondosa TaxID=5627 RepID=A0A1C7MHE3_GRIFR|nr:putative beta-glucosidase J [Grifola frondosa]
MVQLHLIRLTYGPAWIEQSLTSSALSLSWGYEMAMDSWVSFVVSTALRHPRVDNGESHADMSAGNFRKVAHIPVRLSLSTNLMLINHDASTFITRILGASHSRLKGKIADLCPDRTSSRIRRFTPHKKPYRIILGFGSSAASMAPSDFANASILDVVEQLTTDETILLTAGVGSWHTHAVPRLGIPAIKVSDGPNGVRGNHFFMGTPAKCLPSATALGATFDTALIHQAGRRLLAEEAKLKAASVLLGPTCNTQRSPLGGRSFESFSEDPHLSGMMAVAYCKGVQDGGIGVCIKHFVTNDKEDDRMAYDSIVSERALREVYLMPFMLAEKYAQPWCFMTAYNRVNGTHASENPKLIQDILRKEWGSNATVMSDWFGVYSIDHAINAGLDLEMPGTNKWRSLDLMNRSIQSRKITRRTLKERATKVLELVQKCARGAPEILDGDGLERTHETEADKALMRHLAAQSIVLLKNDNAVLPLKPKEQGLKKIAIVGGNAKALVLSGGGSASLKPSYFTTPYDGIADALRAVDPDIEITYCEGARAYMQMPSLDYEIVTESGERGWIGSWHSHESDESMTPLPEPLSTKYIDETCTFISTSHPKELTKRWTLKLRGQLKPRPYDCEFEFGLLSAGRAKVCSVSS